GLAAADRDVLAGSGRSGGCEREGLRWRGVDDASRRSTTAGAAGDRSALVWRLSPNAVALRGRGQDWRRAENENWTAALHAREPGEDRGVLSKGARDVRGRPARD